MNNMDNFDNIFNPFKSKKGKYESMYIFVVYDVAIEDFMDKISKMIGLVDQISNSNKKNHIKKRLYIMLNLLEGLKKESKLNNIYMLDDDVSIIELQKDWKNTLIHFKCDNVTIRYSDEYQLEWLKLYLLDTTYTNVIHVKNNVLCHYHLNSTKKRLHYENESKGLDILHYINENIQNKQICVVHGVSSALKNLSDEKFVRVYKCDKKDLEILDDIDKFNNNDKSKQLETLLGKLLDPIEGKKIVFGKDIGIAIKSKLLKTLFCSPNMEKKIKEQISSDYIIFDMIVVKSYGNDVGKQLETDFKGAIGIKFY